jgi:hypothetical protein
MIGLIQENFNHINENIIKINEKSYGSIKMIDKELNLVFIDDFIHIVNDKK